VLINLKYNKYVIFVQSRLPVYFSHTPAGTSVQNMVHFAQVFIFCWNFLEPCLRIFDCMTWCQSITGVKVRNLPLIVMS